MADHLILQLKETIRQSPLRAALAFVILITTTVYVCTGHDGYRVAEIGEGSPTVTGSDVTSSDQNVDWEQEIDRVSADEDDAPAVSTRADGRDQYIDARLTHAVAEEDDASLAHPTRVIPVSGEVQHRPASESTVWLLGVLNDE